MSALCLYVLGFFFGTPLDGGAKKCQGGAKFFRLASLSSSHWYEQNSETAPGLLFVQF